MNNLNMDPSLNLIIKDHVLTSFLFHLYPAIDIYEMELDLIVLFSFVHALFLFLLSPLFLVCLECWVSHLGWPS